MLGCQPDSGALKGETRRTPRGTEHVSAKGMWHKGVERRSPGDLDGQLAELFAAMTDDGAVWRQLTTRFKADIFTGLFMAERSEGLSISPTTLLALGARGLALDLDIYCVLKNEPDAGSLRRRNCRFPEIDVGATAADRSAASTISLGPRTDRHRTWGGRHLSPEPDRTTPPRRRAPRVRTNSVPAALPDC